MIVPNLKGGLGNQLFQIAAAAAHASRMDVEWGINYNLDHNLMQGNTAHKYRNTLYKNIAPVNHPKYYQYDEPHFHYTKLPNKKNMLINGYFQSEKYFADKKELIRSIFEFPNTVVDKIDKVLEKIRNEKKTPITVHIRRGDYQANPTIHTLQSVDYYKKAMNFFRGRYPNATFILCTDDIDTVTKEFNMEDFIYSNTGDELSDLYLLSAGDAIIGCNSSFSWWGSWFGCLENETVMPKSWFGLAGPQDYKDVYNINWKLI